MFVMIGKSKLVVVPIFCADATALPPNSHGVPPKIVPGFCHTGAVPAPCETSNCPLVPANEFGINAPLNCTLPVTSNACAG
ncbi:MAG: hypothetical protein ACREOZ_02780, partial [Gloeomargaritales cyanobacterium]